MARLNLILTTQTENGGSYYRTIILEKRCKIKQKIFVHVSTYFTTLVESMIKIVLIFFNSSFFFFNFRLSRMSDLRTIFQTVQKDEIRNGFWVILQEVLHVEMCIF